MAGRVLVGTSGYSYDDWRGVLYGPDTRKSDFLQVYASRFAACELNFTYYRIPTAKSLWLAVQNSLRRVTFTVKAPGRVTHERTDVEAACADLLRALEPMREAGVLGAVLAQFPYSFKNTDESWAYLDRLAALLAGPPLVVEFRHAGFVTDATFSRLRDLGVGFCCVDEPRLRGLMPPVAEATSDVAYVRLHGRNARDWWEHEDRDMRYSYLYRREELAEWVGPVRRLSERARTTFVFFNNHDAGQAVVNAIEMREMIDA
ncbi:MAG: DUF72 domain-containing protein [Deltaproteobacteria bacterium]|nr:DUF72 domain-containing protein [Deltaproteobacteria bacterium]